MVNRFRLAWLITTVSLLGIKSAFAYFCICSLNSCTLMHPNTEFFNKVDSVCSSGTLNANEVTIIKLMDNQLSPSAFKKFPNMTILEIFQGKLASLNQDTFSNAEKLSKLVIQRNNLISLNDSSFKGADNLKDLTISGNPLETLSENAFSNLKHLEILSLTKGKIVALPKKVFQSNIELKKISFNNNQLSIIDPELFRALNKLTMLELANNRLTVFDFKLLRARLVVLNNNQLEKLVINENCVQMYANNNSISTIEVRGENIRKLSVINNRLDDISNITSVRSLTSLSLSGNRLNPKTKFRPLVALEDLDLRSTNIDIKKDTFAGLEKIRLLDLSYNNLTHVDFKIFHSQYSLQTLKYVGNSINSFNYQEAKQYLPQLRVLEICKNGWNSSYLESNFNLMEDIGISGFGSDYTKMCAEKLNDDYVNDDYPDQLEDEVDAPSANESDSIVPATTILSTKRKTGYTSTTKTSIMVSTNTDRYDSNETSSIECSSWFSEPKQCWCKFCRSQSIFIKFLCTRIDIECILHFSTLS